MHRDFSIQISYRAPFLLDIFFGVMNLVVFYFISETVTLRAGNIGGAPTYFSFAAVGIILTVVMQSATTGLSLRLREEQLTGTLEMLVMQPLTTGQLAFGLTGFPFLFGVVRGMFYLFFAALLPGLGLGHANIFGFFLILSATTISLSAVGILLGALILVFKQGAALAAVITFGFGLLSGALFPRDLLPGWLETAGSVLPTRFALDGLRSALFGASGWAGSFLALVLTSLVLLPLSTLFFSAMLKTVKRSGSLSQY
jgi:ABC-type multidrug transport system permease subunit